MQKVFQLTNKFIILATPLILFSLITTVYLSGAVNGNKINSIITMLLFTLMTAAFIAGWFNMVKEAILDQEMEDANSLIKFFPEGVGKYFLSSLGAILIVTILSAIVAAISYFTGMHTIGDPGITKEQITTALSGTEALKSFLDSLSFEQLTKINLWNILLMAAMSLSYLLIILFMPAMFFKNKNPLKAFLISLKDLFSKHFLKTTGIFILILFVNFIISILTTFFAGMAILYFFFTLINFYFITTVAVGIFYYYYLNYVMPQIGTQFDEKV